MTRRRTVLLATLCTSLAGGCAGPESASTTAAANRAAGVVPAPLYVSLTDGDVALANATLDRALERNLSGRPATWRNRSSGNGGSITPLRTYRVANGGFCRDYQETVTVGSDEQAFTATACREPSGLWRPVD